ncbi:MAG: hypothetical protein WBF53_02155 [Litorimonas sp.]
MSEVTDLVIPMLQRLQAEVSGISRTLDVMKDDLQQLKLRTTNIEENMVGLNRRMDNFEVRLDRIERRLDLVEA